MFELMPSACITVKRDQDPDRQGEDGDERAAGMQQEHEADQCNDDAFLGQGRDQGGNGAIDKLGPVVDGHDFDAGSGRLDAISASCSLTVADNVERVGAIALHGDAARHLALAVQFGYAAPLIRHELDPRHVLQAAPACRSPP